MFHEIFVVKVIYATTTSINRFACTLKISNTFIIKLCIFTDPTKLEDDEDIDFTKLNHTTYLKWWKKVLCGCRSSGNKDRDRTNKVKRKHIKVILQDINEFWGSLKRATDEFKTPFSFT